MNILIFNQDWFVEELRRDGHQVVTCGIANHLDVVLHPLLHIDSVIKGLPGGFKPDILVFHDNSAPVMVAGLDETDLPTLFYSVDTHHHVHLHKYLFNLFDETLVAQKDYFPYFEELGNRPLWFPLWASRHVEASDEKKYGAVFVGTLDERLNPERVRFFRELGEKTNINCTTGEYWKIFPHSEIVVNQTVKGDLNFRVFEAMMCGALLLTENSGNGLLELFKDGEHLVTYEKGNANSAASLIEHYLHDSTLCRSIARRGREEILSHHTIAHRAATFAGIISALRKKEKLGRSFALMANMNALAASMEKIDTALSGQALILSMKSLERGINAKEPINDELACHAIISCTRYDRLLKGDTGDKLLSALADSNPELPVLKLAKLRALLNQGETADAQKLALEISSEDTYSTFRKAEDMVQMLLRGG